MTATATRTTLAVTHDRYTDATGLRVAPIEVPAPGEGEVRIRVAAAGLNAYDWRMYKGEPALMRRQFGGRVREPRVVGADVAGVVESVGPGVDGFAAGDRVMGEIHRGALAGLAIAPAANLAHVPQETSLEAASALPMAGLTALQALRDTAAVAPGDRVLVWGASSGVGHLAVQIARALGASRVDAVASGRNAAWLRELGADAVYDYTANQTPTGAYDVVLDVVATASLGTVKRLLAPGGRVIVVGAVGGGRLVGPMRAMAGRIAGGKLRGVDVRGMIAKVDAGDLAMLVGWLGEGTVTPHIERVYNLDQAVDACAALESKHVAGRLVVRVAGD